MKAFIESITLNALGAATGLFIGAVSLHGQDRPSGGTGASPGSASSGALSSPGSHRRDARLAEVTMRSLFRSGGAAVAAVILLLPVAKAADGQVRLRAEGTNAYPPGSRQSKRRLAHPDFEQPADLEQPGLARHPPFGRRQRTLTVRGRPDRRAALLPRR